MENTWKSTAEGQNRSKYGHPLHTKWIDSLPTFVPRIFRQAPTYFSYQHDLESNPAETNTFSGCLRYQVGIFVFRTFLSEVSTSGTHPQNSWSNSGDKMLTSSNSFESQHQLHSCKLTNRHGKSTILMVFTRKHGDLHGRAVSFREGIWKYPIYPPWNGQHQKFAPEISGPKRKLNHQNQPFIYSFFQVRRALTCREGKLVNLMMSVHNWCM